MMRSVRYQDAEQIAAIYNYYVEHTVVTFEEEIVSSADITKRIEKVLALNLPWIVVEEQGVILGYAYAGKWRERSAYRFSVETTVYLAPDAQGRGLGTALYQELIEQLKALDVNAVIGGVTLPNDASVALHEKIGMKKVGHFPEVGFKFDQWFDVGFWQLNLPRS